MNKGQVEVSFNWIFILIAGGAILFFFFMVIDFETEATEEEISRTVGERMDSIFGTLSAGSGTYQSHDSVSFFLDFECDGAGNHLFRVNEGSSEVILESEVFFSPRTIGNGELYTWTETFSKPMPISNLLYVSDQNTRYVFDDEVSHIQSNFPDVFETVELDSFSDQGHDHHIFISEEDIGGGDIGGLDAESYDIVIVGDEEITFKDEVDDGGESAGYIEDELLYGAVITGDKDIYACAKNKLLDQAVISYKIQENRTKSVLKDLEELSDTDACKIQYGGLYSNFEVLAESIVDLDHSDIENNVEVLESANDNIRGISECPTMY